MLLVFDRTSNKLYYQLFDHLLCLIYVILVTIICHFFHLTYIIWVTDYVTLGNKFCYFLSVIYCI